MDINFRNEEIRLTNKDKNEELPLRKVRCGGIKCELLEVGVFVQEDFITNS